MNARRNDATNRNCYWGREREKRTPAKTSPHAITQPYTGVLVGLPLAGHVAEESSPRFAHARLFWAISAEPMRLLLRRHHAVLAQLMFVRRRPGSGSSTTEGAERGARIARDCVSECLLIDEGGGGVLQTCFRRLDLAWASIGTLPMASLTRPFGKCPRPGIAPLQLLSHTKPPYRR